MKKVALALLLMLLCLPALAEPLPEGLPGYTLKDTGEVRVYATPSIKGNLAGYVSKETPLTVIAADGDWCQVQFTGAYGVSSGYIPLSFFDVAPVATPALASSPSFEAGTRGTVRNLSPGWRLNLRGSPSPTAKSLGKYWTGAEVIFTGAVENGYAEVEIGGQSGWMDLRCLDTAGSVLIECPIVTVDNASSGVNVRKGPGSAFALTGWLPHGTQLILLGVTENGWYHVETPEGAFGFVTGTLLSETYPFASGTDNDSAAASDLAAGGTVMYVSATSLRLRGDASTSAKVLGQFYQGTPVEVLSYTRTGFAYVRIGQTVGYMDASYLAESTRTGASRLLLVDNPYGTGLNLRALPDEGSALLAFLPDGTQTAVLGLLNDGWYLVEYGGSLGYLHEDGARVMN